MEPANAEDPKQLGKDLIEKLKSLVAVLERYEASRNNYPFVGEMLNPLAKLKKVASKSPAYFFTECSSGELDAQGVPGRSEVIFRPVTGRHISSKGD